MLGGVLGGMVVWKFKSQTDSLIAWAVISRFYSGVFRRHSHAGMSGRRAEHQR